MTFDTTSMSVLGILLLIAAVPWVMRIRHPQQKPFAAYLVFVSVFLITATLVFGLLTWLLSLMDLGRLIAEPFGAAVFLTLVFIPALLVGTWQARKPPMRRAPPA